MSTEEKETKLDSPSESESISCLQTEEAIAKLEDHRCAICQNIIINACRIDCGHTFCRHCLNVDKENRNNGSKSTCFICDAAVTEIARNEEKDKEIDALYATLPTKERLGRERTKSDRKKEEEDFQKKPKEPSNNVQQHVHAHTAQTSNATIGSGDGAASLSPYTLVRNTNDWSNADENNNINVQVPTFYGGTFRIWPRESDYDLPDHGERIHRRHMTYHDGNESSDDVDGGVQFNQPPMLVRHTIQHVYHTLEVSSTEQNDPSEDEAARDHSARNAEPDHHHDHTSEYTPPPCTCRNNGPFPDVRYHGYPYMNSPGSAQSIPRVYAYPQYVCGYPYATPTCYHPSSGVNTHFVPLTYQNQRASYPTPINIPGNSTNIRFCPVGDYRQHVNVLRNPYAHATANNEPSLDDRRHENGSDNEMDDAGPSTGDTNGYGCECHRPLQYIRLRPSPESLPSAFRTRSSRFDYDGSDRPSVRNDSNESEAHPFRGARMEISETRQEHSDHEDHVFTLSFSVPRPERQETETPQSSVHGFSRFGEISRGPRRF